MIVRVFAIALLFVTVGCGGGIRLGAPAEGPKGGKGTSVVNPVNPDKVFWDVMRGSQSAEAPLKTGDWVNVKCVECENTTTWVTIWTRRDGTLYRTLYLDEPTAPFLEWQVAFVEDDEELMVLWSTEKLGSVPSTIEDLNWFEGPRRSPVLKDDQPLGELHWGPILNTSQAWRGTIKGLQLARAR